MSRLALALVAALALTVSACGGSDSPGSPTQPTPPSSPAPPSNPTPPSGGQSTPVSIPNGATTAGANAFGMNPLTIAVGATVTWTNNDSVAHTATADAAGGFNTGNIAPGASASATFSAAGTVKYHCAIHPGMIGTIVVQ